MTATIHHGDCLDVLRAAKAQALRDAAHEISEWIRAGADGEATAEETWQWLRARADKIEEA